MTAVSTINVSVNEIIEGVTSFTLSVVFDQAMNTNFTPIIGLPGTVASTLAFDSDGWTTTSATNDTYEITYLVTDADVDMEGIDVNVSNAVSFTGIQMTLQTVQDAFSIDTLIGTPAAPDLALSSDTGISGTDDLTKTDTPTFDVDLSGLTVGDGGDLEAGDRVQIIDASGNVYGETTLTGSEGASTSVTVGSAVTYTETGEATAATLA